MGASMGPYGPFVGLNRMAAQAQALQLANQLTQGQLGAQDTLGRAMMTPNFGSPDGSSGGPPGGVTPMPGQSSQPAQLPQITPQGVTGLPGGTPMPSDPSQPLPQLPTLGSPAGGAQAASAGGMLQQEPVSSTSPQATTQAAGQEGQPPPAAPGQQGVVSLDKVLAGIVKANPGATPKQVYNAAALYLPFMVQQDQVLLRQALMQTQLARTDLQGQYHMAGINAQQQGATERANMRIAAGDRRSQAAISAKYAQMAQQAEQFAQRQDYLQASRLRDEMYHEAQIASQAAMTAQDQAGAANIMQQAEADRAALEQQLQARTQPGATPGNMGTLNTAPKKVKTITVPTQPATGP